MDDFNTDFLAFIRDNADKGEAKSFSEQPDTAPQSGSQAKEGGYMESLLQGVPEEIAAIRLTPMAFRTIRRAVDMELSGRDSEAMVLLAAALGFELQYRTDYVNDHFNSELKEENRTPDDLRVESRETVIKLAEDLTKIADFLRDREVARKVAQMTRPTTRDMGPQAAPMSDLLRQFDTDF